MIDSTVRLPNGHEVTVTFPEGTSEKEIKDWVFDEYVLNRDPGSKFGRSIAQGIDDLQASWGSALEGLGNVIDAESLSQIGGNIVENNRNEIEARRYKEQQYTTESEGFSKGIDYVTELAGQSAPQMGTSIAAAYVGGKIGLLGGPLAPITVPLGAFVGTMLVNVPYFYGSNRERQKEAIDRGYRTEMDEGAAALAAVPQAAMDAVITRLMPKFLGTPKMKTDGGIFTKVVKGTGEGVLIETPTEMGQTFLERYQAGLPLDDDEAIKEYVDAGVGGATLGGLFGGSGGAYTGIREMSTQRKIEGAEDQGPVQTEPQELKQPTFAEPETDQPLRYRVSYMDEFTGEESQLELEARSPNDAASQVAERLGLDPSGMRVETLFPSAEPEVAPTEPEVAAVEPEVIPTEPEVALAEPKVAPAAQDLDVEAIREQESIISDADARIMELESEVDIEKSNIKEARAENKKKIAEVRKSNLSKEEKQERVEDLKAELQDTIDDINGNIGIYKEEISAFKSDKRKATKKLSKLTTPAEPTFTPEEEAALQAELEEDVTAEATATYIPQRFVGERAEAAPPFFKKFQPEQYDEGRFVDLETTEDLSDQTFEGGSIRIQDGRPVLETSDTSTESIMERKASEEGALVRSNLFKQKAGWKWTQAPEGKPSTIVSVEQGSKHYYTLDFTSGKPLTLKTYPDKKSEPRGRPTTRGEVKLGNKVGEIEVRGKKHPVYDRVTVGEPEVVAGAATIEKVNATNQIDVVDSTVTQLVEPVEVDPAEGGKVRSIAKRFRLKSGIIDFKKLFQTTGSLKVSEKVYNSTVKKAADRISKVLDKAFVQFPQFEAWYSSRLNMAMDIFEELDPDLAKPEDRFIMKTLLAVTSNGNEVSDQTAESFRIYKDWKRTGRLEQQSTQGTREEAILGHLLLVDELISRVGWKELESFMSKVGPVSKLREELESQFGFTKKQAKDMTNGELVTEVVPYSLFLGPKLGSFFNNLNGNFETTTMDRWFMRTFGRAMGDQLIKVDTQAARTRLLDAMGELLANPESKLFGELKKQGLLPKSGKLPTKEQIKRIATYFSLKANRQGLTPVENEVRLAINGIAKVSDGFKMIEAPASGSHRRFIRAVMKEALADFNKKNDTNFTPAEAQAILWYYEKLIHESNGSRQKGEAPDYAAGANAIYRNLNGRDSGRFVRSDVIRRRGDLPSGTQELSERDITAPAAAAGNRAFNQPLPDATTVSEQYARSSGIPFQKPERITSLNKERAAKIGRAFDEMKHDPTNPEVQESYNALVQETLDQYQSILDAGYSIEINNTEPYNNSAEMIEDLRSRKTMRVFSTEFGFGDKGISAKDRSENPMLAETEFKDTNGVPLLVNDVFRFVHDFFGHAKLGNGFGPIGEENAWNVHSRMYSPLARRAMTTETRGQNSWVNFSGVNDEAFRIRDRARKARKEGDTEKAKRLTEEAYDTMRFADQKIGLMPEEFTRTDDEITAGTGEQQFFGRGYSSARELDKFVTDAFLPIADKLGIDIVPNYTIGGGGAQYNVTRGVIEYNPNKLIQERNKQGIRAVFREEIIHAAMHNVLMKRHPGKSRNAAWLDFMGKLGKDLTQDQREAIAGVYMNLSEDHQFGAEYSRAVIQQYLYGEMTESYAGHGKSFKDLIRILKSVQSYIVRLFKNDISTDPEAAAIIRDSADLVQALDPGARPTNQTAIKEATRMADMADGTQEVTSDVVASAGKPPSKKKGIGFAKKYFFTPSVIMDRIHPELSRLFHKFFNGIDRETLAYMNRVAPFIKKFNAIENEKDKRRLKQLLYYSPDLDPRAEDIRPLIEERTALLRKYDMLMDYDINVRSVLNAIRQRANQEGMEVAFLNDYFPRQVLDLDSIREYYGETIVKDFSSYIERINEVRRKEMDPKKRKPPIERGSTEEAIEFDKYIRSGEYTRRGAKPRNTKARTIEFIDDAILDSYADPGVAIEAYINNMVLATRTMQLLGRRYEVEGENILFEKSGELGELIQRLVMNGEIDEETAFRTIPQFARMILNPVMKENAFLSNLRSFSYLTLLVEPTSTLSNLFDLPFVMYQKGFFPTMAAMLGNKSIKLEDIGVDPNQVSLEFKSERKLLADSVRLGLKATGFTRLDQLLKETNLNANYNYYRKLARGYLRDRQSSASRKLKVEFDFLLGDDADAAIAAFAKGDRNNPLVREVVTRKILETQPLNRMEMPLGQSESADKRILYTMKSFQVKQLNFVVDKMLSRIFSNETTNPEKLAATKDLARLMFFMLIVGMPVDALKDLLAGRIGYLSDYVFNGIFRIAGISRYTAYSIKKEGVGEAALDYFTPVGLQQVMDVTGELQNVVTGKKAITDSKLVTLAPLSDVINRMFGFTRERERKEFKKRAREGERPILVPPGALR